MSITGRKDAAVPGTGMDFENVTLMEKYRGFNSSTTGTLTIVGDRSFMIKDANSSSEMHFKVLDFCLPLRPRTASELHLPRSQQSELSEELEKILLKTETLDVASTLFMVFQHMQWGDPPVRVVEPSEFLADIDPGNTMDTNDTDNSDIVVENTVRRDPFGDYGATGPSLDDVRLQTQPTPGARRVDPVIGGRIVPPSNVRRQQREQERLREQLNAQNNQNNRVARSPASFIAPASLPASLPVQQTMPLAGQTGGAGAGSSAYPMGSLYSPNGPGLTSPGQRLGLRGSDMVMSRGRIARNRRRGRNLPQPTDITMGNTVGSTTGVNGLSAVTIASALQSILSTRNDTGISSNPPKMTTTVKEARTVTTSEASCQTDDMQMCGECKTANGLL